MADETAASATQTAEAGATATQATQTTQGAQPADQATQADTGRTADTGFTWPENWRDQIAGDDKKARKSLETVRDPRALYDRYTALRARMDSGELKAPFPAEGSDEDKAAWRKQNGIPDAPAAYLEKLPDGIELSDMERQFAADFAAKAHGKNWTPEQVHDAIAFKKDMDAKFLADQLAKDNSDKQEVEEHFISTQGLADYRKNVTGLVSWLENLPGDAGGAIMNARGPDGRALLNTPEVVEALMQAVREIDPSHMLTPGAGADAGRSIDTRIGEIEKMMGRKNSDYWKGPMKDQIQAEYRELIAARDKLSARAA